MNTETLELEVSVPAAGLKVEFTGKMEGNTVSFPLCLDSKTCLLNSQREHLYKDWLESMLAN